MKVLISFFSLILIVVSCQPNKQEQKQAIAENYNVFGDTILVSETTQMANLNSIYDDLAIGDTISTKITAVVTEVCKKKGCWMKLDLDQDREIMVHFKDYGFFVPKDIAGKKVILQGNAFVEQVSVEDQQHYAMDGGKSEAEVAAITRPKKTYTFLANGVLIKK